MNPEVDDLPLRSRTPDAWAERALSDPKALLDDHAHLEKKAAANALELLNRWPEGMPPRRWIAAMTSIARDECNHLAQVCRLLRRKGGKLSRAHRNPYANDLRALVRKGEGNRELVDRLLVSALIEARSCERFEVLARVGGDADLLKLYRALWASEKGHYLAFVDLARQVLPDAEVTARWQTMLDREAAILAAQPPGPRMHSGA